MPSWIMSSIKREHGIEFYIGAVRVCVITWTGKPHSKVAMLHYGSEIETFPTTSEAMKRMHELLRSPTPEE